MTWRKSLWPTVLQWITPPKLLQKPAVTVGYNKRAKLQAHTRFISHVAFPRLLISHMRLANMRTKIDDEDEKEKKNIRQTSPNLSPFLSIAIANILPDNVSYDYSSVTLTHNKDSFVFQCQGLIPTHVQKNKTKRFGYQSCRSLMYMITCYCKLYVYLLIMCATL